MAIGPLSLLSGTAYTMMLPNIYESTAIAQIKFSNDTHKKYTPDALVALTQQKAALAESPQTFYPVIKELKLQEAWGDPENKIPRNIAHKILQDSVRITADKHAVGLIRFSVQRDNPIEPAKIANAIGKTYANQYDDISMATMALPAIRPVSPNLFRNVLLFSIQAAVLSIIGVVLLVLGIRKEKPNPRVAPIANP